MTSQPMTARQACTVSWSQLLPGKMPTATFISRLTHGKLVVFGDRIGQELAAHIIELRPRRAGITGVHVQDQVLADLHLAHAGESQVRECRADRLALRVENVRARTDVHLAAVLHCSSYGSPGALCLRAPGGVPGRL